jgi:hypothetical protein
MGTLNGGKASSDLVPQFRDSSRPVKLKALVIS